MLKRIFYLITLICVLVSIVCSALCETEFTLHNGTKFGMTSKEIIETEKNGGFDFSIDSNTGTAGSEGLVAGQQASIYYYFDENGMYKMSYSFSSSNSYGTIENALMKKYGTTDFNEISGMSFPEPNGKASPTISKSGGSSGFRWTYVIKQYSHRLVPINNAQFMMIEHVSYDMINDFGFGTPTTSDMHSVRYTLLNQEEYEQILNTMNSLQSDDL